MTLDDGHNSQYQPGASPITRRAGCTWTTGATGVAVVTSSRYTPSPDKIHSLVARSEETNPKTPGWSLDDLKLALSRFGMSFQVHTGEGWAAVEKAVDDRRFVVIQGDSDQFGNATCSGAFDGDHCIGIDGSKQRVVNGVEEWWLHDPICPTGRWERKGVIRRYAEKLLASVRFGWFSQRIPRPDTWTWELDPVPPRKRVSFATLNVVNGVVRGDPVRHTTAGTARYHCSAPRKYPWPGHRDIPLVLLGKRVDGKAGPLEGKYVHARYAKGS